MSESPEFALSQHELTMPLAFVGPGTSRQELRVTELRRSDVPSRGVYEIWHPLLDYIDADLRDQQPRLDAVIATVRNYRFLHERYDESKSSLGNNARAKIAKHLAKGGLVAPLVKTGSIEELIVAKSECPEALGLPAPRPSESIFSDLTRRFVLLGTIKMGARRAAVAGLITVEQGFDMRKGPAFRVYSPAVQRLAHIANEDALLRSIRSHAMTLEAERRTHAFSGGLPGTRRKT